MSELNRRRWLEVGAASVGALAIGDLRRVLAKEENTDSLPMQLYKSLSDEQRAKVCLPVDHPRRQYVSNWWYIHPEHRIPATFNAEQQQLVKQIFDSLHSEAHQDAVNQQVLLDQYGEEKNAPAAGFFGSPEDDDFEFIFTGHHVTRRCNAHTDKGMGFGGAPVFYGHYPHPLTSMRENFREAKDHPGNPYWYQGKVFNRFVQSLDASQRQQGLRTGVTPRSESPDSVIAKSSSNVGLACRELNEDQQRLFRETIRDMLGMFRAADVEATLKTIETNDVIDRLHISWFDGKYDIGGDRVWDTWQIEGPDMVWYFRGEPHIHCYFHLKA